VGSAEEGEGMVSTRDFLRQQYSAEAVATLLDADCPMPPPEVRAKLFVDLVRALPRCECLGCHKMATCYRGSPMGYSAHYCDKHGGDGTYPLAWWSIVKELEKRS
jgi:hypothetical protein